MARDGGIDVMTEADDGGDGGDFSPAAPAPSAFSTDNGMAGIRDLPRGTDSRPVRQPEPQIEIVETDDDGRAMQDARLDEERGDGTYVDRQRRASNDRESRQQRRERQREGRERTLAENERLRREIAALRERVDGFEPRLSEFDQARAQQVAADIDRQIAEAHAQQKHAAARMSEAILSADGTELEKAMTLRDQAFVQVQRLTMQKSQMEAGGYRAPSADDGRTAPGQPQPRQQQSAPRLAPDVLERVNEFRSEHQWYKPEDRGTDGRPRDFDTRVALEIDAAVAAEGFNPRSQDYWDEVNDRMQRYLPHRFGQAARSDSQDRMQERPPALPPRESSPQSRGPRVIGGGEGAPAASSSNRLYLSPQRRESLELAGVMDRNGRVLNEAKFRNIAKQYMDFDRANGVAAR